MRKHAALLGVLLLTLVPSVWARAAGDRKLDLKTKSKAGSKSPTPTPTPTEPKIPDREITLKGKFRGTVEGVRFEQPFNLKGKTSEKLFVHCDEPGLDVTLAIMPRPLRDDKNALLLDMYVHCKTRKHHFQRQAQVMVEPTDTAPIDLNSKTDKDKIQVEVVIGQATTQK
jgi:hypothetical protein